MLWANKQNHPVNVLLWGVSLTSIKSFFCVS